MTGQIREHIRSNVVGYLALSLSLGLGTAWALETNSVKSRHIAPGQVKLSDTNDKLRLKCPAGTRYHEGACFETSVRTDPGTTAAEWVQARNDCADEDRRLPTWPELETFRSEPGITVGGEDGYQEWTSTWWFDRGASDDRHYVAVLQDNGGYNQLVITSSNQYRCVAAATR